MVRKKEFTMTDTSIPAETRIGHVHLKVADLDRAIGFYRDYLGFDLLFNFESAAPSSPPAATTTTSASTRGRARTGRPPPPA
jgi:catechol 2,3-dioxygenase